MVLHVSYVEDLVSPQLKLQQAAAAAAAAGSILQKHHVIVRVCVMYAVRGLKTFFVAYRERTACVW